MAEKANPGARLAVDLAEREKSGRGAGPDRRWALLRAAWRVAEPESPVARCHRVRRGPVVELRAAEAGGWAEGVVTCGSVWTCAVCATRKAALRYQLVLEGVDRWSAKHPIGKVFKELDSQGFRFHTRDCCGYREGASFLLETRTVKHGLGDSLAELGGNMRRARNWFKGHRRYKAARALAGAVGTIRAEELTHGRNGWHPHEHELWFCERELAEGTRSLLEYELAELWQEACTRHGLPEPTIANGYTLRPQEGENAAYVAKWGLPEEIALSVVKTGREGGRSPWDLLEAAAKGGQEAGRLWLEYAEAQKGARQLHWSRGLKRLLGLEDWKPAAVESSTVYVLEAAEWRAICRSRQSFLEDLFAAISAGQEAIWRVVQRALELSQRASDTS